MKWYDYAVSVLMGFVLGALFVITLALLTPAVEVHDETLPWVEYRDTPCVLMPVMPFPEED